MECQGVPKSTQYPGTQEYPGKSKSKSTKKDPRVTQYCTRMPRKTRQSILGSDGMTKSDCSLIDLSAL